ncbi:MAG: LD-carboxypeptidase [Flavisolibacter sp.]|nr:LD-carboxypeptidase [Flavisolibacter sp.]
MNRRKFINAGSALTAGLIWTPKLSGAYHSDESNYKKPPYLKYNDTIGITSPAGFITKEAIAPAVQLIKDWGYKIKIGDTIGKRDFSFGGTDEERKNDFQQMLDDPNIKAILCARGGYGIVRFIDQLNWENFKKHPKWIIGFSDITVLHFHIHKHTKIASIHSKMINSFPDDWWKAEPIQRDTIISIKQALSGTKMNYEAIPNNSNKTGTANGILIGGNLKLIESMAGTASDITTDGKILFIEDTGEYLYSIDRMLWNLKRTGKLKKLAGLVVGGFRIKPDDPGEEFGRTLEQLVLEKVKLYDYPVCFDFPLGHQRANFAYKCGVMHRLQVQAGEVSLKEL